MKAKKVLSSLSIILSVVGLVMFLIRPVVSMEYGGELYGDTCIQAIKGIEGANPTYMLIVPIVLSVIGIVAACLYAAKKDKKFALAAAVAFVLTFVLFLCSKAFYLSANEDTIIAVAKDFVDLGAGAIIGGILTLAAAVTSVVSAFLKD